MNLADMLSYADIHQLSTIADTYECECNGHSKNELIQAILTRVNRKEVFEQQVGKLSLEDLRFMNSLLFDQRDLFSLEELVARVQLTKFEKKENDNWNPREVISKFKQKGWIFNGYSQQTKYLFQVPQDVKLRFIDALSKQFKHELNVLDREPVAYRDEQKLIVDDMYQFLHYLHHNEVVITADGSMYKRSLQSILDSFAVREEQVMKGAWRFGYGRKFKEYPNRFSLIYDYCYFQGLIREDNGKLTLSEQGTTNVLQGKKEDIMQVYRFWLRLYKGPIANLQTLVLWTEKLASEWVTSESLGNVLCALIKPFYYDSSESIYEQRFLQMLMHLGLIRIGEDEQWGKVIMLSKLGQSVILGTYVAEEDKIELQIDN